MHTRKHRSTDRRHRATSRWIVPLACVTLVFDGYDLVVHGTAVPVRLRDPSRLGSLTPGRLRRRAARRWRC